MMNNPFLPAQWQTDRLVVRDSALNEVAELREVFNNCLHVDGDPVYSDTAHAFLTLEKLL